MGDEGCCDKMSPTCLQQQGHQLAGLAVSDGVEERSLTHPVHHVDLGPRPNTLSQDGEAGGTR